jgi:anthranilate synthase/aminodeoxychorismate synthase-like glutamine amidotransferase
MIALIDNYDSFTFNVYDYLARQCDVRVFRNTDDLEIIKPLDVKGIVLSPGPSHPSKSGLSLDALDHYSGQVPILGICLGMQAIAYKSGNQVRKGKTIMHGKVDRMDNRGGVLFRGIEQEFTAVRYHSLVVDVNNGGFTVCAISKSDGEIMAIENKERRIFGLQFHPESYATPQGMTFIRNFLEVCDGNA